MITVLCAEWGNYLGRGAEYVDVLSASVSRNLGVLHRFVVATDDERRHSDRHDTISLPRKHKSCLFRPGLIESERILFLDLDSVVVGPLAPLAKPNRIIDLRDWGWNEAVLGSAVMCWRSGQHAEVDEDFNETAAAMYGADDQRWITRCGGWTPYAPGLCVSYRYHGNVRGSPPPGASVVCFHGRPKPHEVDREWVKNAWRAS